MLSKVVLTINSVDKILKCVSVIIQMKGIVHEWCVPLMPFIMLQGGLIYPLNLDKILNFDRQ